LLGEIIGTFVLLLGVAAIFSKKVAIGEFRTIPLIGEWGFWAGKGFRAASIPLGEKAFVRQSD
jgi:hypothetical protein